jgi:hypothetical protein
MRVVAEFLADEPRRTIDRATQANDSQSAVLHSQYLRLQAWLASLARLQRPEDVQAVIAGGRAVFEIAVDAVLLQADQDGCAKMLDWEESAKLKQAQALSTYLTKRKLAPTAEDRPPLAFASSEGARINLLRRRWSWVDPTSGKPKHPSRWTGQDLGADCVSADAASPAYAFERYYETRYRPVCWTTHGSGAVGMRGVGAMEFPFLGAQAYRETADFAIIAARNTLQHAGAWTPALELAFHGAESQARRRAGEVFGKTQRIALFKDDGVGPSEVGG